MNGIEWLFAVILKAMADTVTSIGNYTSYGGGWGATFRSFIFFVLGIAQLVMIIGIVYVFAEMLFFGAQTRLPFLGMIANKFGGGDDDSFFARVLRAVLGIAILDVVFAAVLAGVYMFAVYGLRICGNVPPPTPADFFAVWVRYASVLLSFTNSCPSPS